MEWVICASAVVAILKKPNPGVRVSDWTNTAKDLLSTRESLTFMTLATKVGARSAELREVFGSSVSSSSHASAPKQVLHAGSAPSGRKGKKCTICSKSGHLAGDCIKNEQSPNYGKSLAEVKAAKKKGKGRSKSSYARPGFGKQHLGAIHLTCGPTNPTVLSVTSKGVVAIDTQANISLVNDVRAFKPGTYREFDESGLQQHSIMGFNGASQAEGMGTAVLVLYGDDGDSIVVEVKNAYYKRGFSHNLLSAFELQNRGVEVERNNTGLLLPSGLRIPLFYKDGLLFSRGKAVLHQTREGGKERAKRAVNLAATVPANVPADVPANVSANVPANVPANGQANVPNNVLANGPPTGQPTGFRKCRISQRIGKSS